MRFLSSLLIISMILTLCVGVAVAESDARTIRLSSEQTADGYRHAATVDGVAVSEYDYTWHADPAISHDEVKNSPAEYFTGTKPTGDDPVYIAHDIYYYPLLEQEKFQQIHYDGETEWAYFYEAPGYENYIFSTLPSLRTGFPSQMMHTEEEAYQNAVLYITQPGTYTLEGSWHGQIRVDLGEDAFDDPAQKVTLILSGVDITCTVAPGVVFANVYECDNAWEDADSHSRNVDTGDAGANVILADGTVNNVSGTNIFRILKTQYKDDDSADTYPAQKKRLKMDGAFYSYQSMNILGQSAGTGVLNIASGFEGLNSELHLTLLGGNVNIYSQDDGMNVNEDGVSVLTVNGGSLHICAGLGAEGDGIDSNGYVVINGGTVICAANPASDSGLDSDCGSFVNGGTVVALGSTMDWAEADETDATAQAILNLRFSASQNDTEAIILTDTDGKVVFAYDPDKDEVSGTNRRTYSGAVISAPGLKTGGVYRLYVGGDVTGSEVSGVYDPATVTGFADSALQCYSGNAIGGMGGMRPDGMPQGGGFRPDEMEGNELPQRPEGGFGGFDPMGGNPQQGAQMGATCTGSVDFSLSQTVNAFSAVADFRHDLQQDSATGHYICSVCKNTYADAEGADLIFSGNAPAAANVWGYVLCFLAGAATASIVFTIALAIRKKKA